MLDKETERKVGFLHMFLGAIAGVASAFSESGLLVAVVFAWVARILSIGLFKIPPDEFTPKVWIGKGLYLFFVVWLLLWVFVYNLLV